MNNRPFRRGFSPRVLSLGLNISHSIVHSTPAALVRHDLRGQIQSAESPPRDARVAWNHRSFSMAIFTSWRMRSSSYTAPVGLLGLTSAMPRVLGVIRPASTSGSGAHPCSAAVGIGTGTAPRALRVMAWLKYHGAGSRTWSSGSRSVTRAANPASLAPAVTISSRSGSHSTPRRSAAQRARAERSSGRPGSGVYRWASGSPRTPRTRWTNLSGGGMSTAP